MNENPFKDGGTWCGRWYPGFPAQMAGNFLLRVLWRGAQYNPPQWREKWTLSSAVMRCEVTWTKVCEMAEDIHRNSLQTVQY